MKHRDTDTEGIELDLLVEAIFRKYHYDFRDYSAASLKRRLLQALEPQASYEAVAQRLTALPVPNHHHLAAPPQDMVRLADGTIVSAAIASGFPERLAALRVEDHARSYAHACYLWTVGGPNFEPLALTGHALPDPYLFAGLLTGRFDGHLAPERAGS